MRVIRYVLLKDKVGYCFGTIVKLGDAWSGRGVFIRRDSGDITYAHHCTYGINWFLWPFPRFVKEIPLKYDLVKQRQMKADANKGL